jgi:enoyl-CoA hydratase/carnithine racemase
MSQLDVTRRGRIAVLTMNRPQNANRVSQQMAEEITAALEQARRDPEVGACVITGRGDVFCLGGDWQGAGAATTDRMEFARAFIDMHQAFARLGKPLIAAINGNAHAGGFSIVVACDLAVAAHDATLGLPEAAHGLFPFLALAAVKDQLPKKLLFDIVYNARLMTPEEVRTHCLINEIAPRSSVLDRAVAIAEKASATNAEILMLGRDLYYGMRSATPAEAFDHSRAALLSALAARDRSGERR